MRRRADHIHLFYLFDPRFELEQAHKVRVQRPELEEAINWQSDAASARLRQACPAGTGCGVCFLGPRLRATRTRMRSSNSTGELAPLGRKASAASARSKLVTVPETMSVGSVGCICLARRTSSLPSMPGQQQVRDEQIH